MLLIKEAFYIYFILSPASLSLDYVDTRPGRGSQPMKRDPDSNINDS